MSTEHDRESSPNPEDVWRKLVQQPYRDDVMEALGTSIELAHRHGPKRWGIRLTHGPEGIMLKVGMHEILQLVDGSEILYLIVDKHTVPAKVRSQPQVTFIGDKDCYGNLGAEGYYPSNPGSEACNIPFAKVKDAYQALLESHETIIARAARTRRNPTTRGTHSPQMVRFVATSLGKSLPQPAYSNT